MSKGVQRHVVHSRRRVEGERMFKRDIYFGNYSTLSTENASEGSMQRIYFTLDLQSMSARSRCVLLVEDEVLQSTLHKAKMHKNSVASLR